MVAYYFDIKQLNVPTTHQIYFLNGIQTALFSGFNIIVSKN